LSESFHPVVQVLLAGIVAWALTGLGAGAVLFTKEVN